MRKDETGSKRCAKCGQSLSTALFGPHKKTRDGLHSYCRPCISAVSKAWYEANPDRRVELNRAQRKKNAGRSAAICAESRARKTGRTAGWANRFFIEEAYRLAALRTKKTGVVWQVDHIVPLHGFIVSGLHVENNLQVILATENARKHRSFTESTAIG